MFCPNRQETPTDNTNNDAVIRWLLLLALIIQPFAPLWASDDKQMGYCELRMGEKCFHPLTLCVSGQEETSDTASDSRSPQKPATLLLPNGMRLILESRAGTGLVAIDLCVRAGTRQENEQTNGVAHFIEHMVFKGTATRRPGELDRELEQLGGEFTARTTRDATRYDCVVPSAKWRDALALLAELTLAPAFRADDMEKERAVIQAEMAVAQTEPERIAYSQLAGVVFDSRTAYPLPILGRPANIARFTPNDLKTFWQRWYRPEHMTLTLVGDFTAADVTKFVTFLFRGDKPATQPEPEVTTFVPLGRVVRANSLPPEALLSRELVTVLVGFRAPSVRDNGLLPVLDALMPTLANGRRGRLAERLIEKDGAALTVAADFLPGHESSLILLTFTTYPKRVAQLERSLEAELRRLREDPLTETEADAAVATVLNRVRYESETVEERAKWLSHLDLAAPNLTETTYREELGKVRADALNQALSRYLSPIGYAIAVVGPPPAEENSGFRVPSGGLDSGKKREAPERGLSSVNTGHPHSHHPQFVGTRVRQLSYHPLSCGGTPSRVSARERVGERAGRRESGSARGGTRLYSPTHSQWVPEANHRTAPVWGTQHGPIAQGNPEGVHRGVRESGTPPPTKSEGQRIPKGIACNLLSVRDSVKEYLIPHTQTSESQPVLTLNNGARLVVVPNAGAETVAVYVFFQVGRQEERSESGLNALLARAWGDASESRGTALLRNDIARVGSVGTDFSEDWVALWGISGAGASDLRKSLQTLLVNLVANPKFTPESVGRAAAEQEQAILFARDSLVGSTLTQLRERAYGSSPYAVPVQGSPERLFFYKADKLTAHYARYFRPERCVVAVAGKVDAKEIADLVEASFGAGGWNAGSATQRIDLKGQFASPARIPIRPQRIPPDLKDMSVARFSPATVWTAGWLAPGTENDSNSKTYATLLLLDAVMGGGKASRLFQTLRDAALTPLAYDVRTRLEARRGQSLWAVYLTGNSQASAIKTALFAEINDIVSGKRPISAGELARARTCLQTRHQLERQRVKDQAFNAGWAEVMGIGGAFDSEFSARLADVTVEDINRLATTLLASPPAIVYVPAR